MSMFPAFDSLKIHFSGRRCRNMQSLLKNSKKDRTPKIKPLPNTFGEREQFLWHIKFAKVHETDHFFISGKGKNGNSFIH